MDGMCYMSNVDVINITRDTFLLLLGLSSDGQDINAIFTRIILTLDDNMRRARQTGRRRRRLPNKFPQASDLCQ